MKEANKAGTKAGAVKDDVVPRKRAPRGQGGSKPKKGKTKAVESEDGEEAEEGDAGGRKKARTAVKSEVEEEGLGENEYVLSHSPYC